MVYNYGKTFKVEKRIVCYRYTDKKLSTKTLVYNSTKKPVKAHKGSRLSGIRRSNR